MIFPQKWCLLAFEKHSLDTFGRLEVRIHCPPQALRKADMRGYSKNLAAAALALLLGATAAAARNPQEKETQTRGTQSKDTQQSQDTQQKPAQDKDTQQPQQAQDKSSGPAPWYSPSRYNPAKLFKHYKSANDQLASDAHLEDNLSKQLRIQGILGADRELQDVCSDFKDLPNCVAVLRLSVGIPVEFTCLKWNVTGVKPKNAADSCAGPAGGKAMLVDRALDLLKPNLDVRAQAREALRKAHDDIKDASS